ncbi:MAG: helix-turn-helix domain-containing protein [Actinophytocola sp.]|nr:helix-turn-helix domain-containing protein [Actinophytocola sp.]
MGPLPAPDARLPVVPRGHVGPVPVRGRRCRAARDWLRQVGVTVATIAGRLGYQSEAAFSRAFKRVIGVSPGAARR